MAGRSGWHDSMSVVTVGNGCGPLVVEVGCAGRRSDSEGGGAGKGLQKALHDERYLFKRRLRLSVHVMSSYYPA